MTTWAVIPAKDPHAAKTRLAPLLDPRQRADLARRLLAGTVEAALDCPLLAGVVVVSASPELRRVALDLGAHACPEPEGANMLALERGNALSWEHGDALSWERGTCALPGGRPWTGKMPALPGARRGTGWKPAVPGEAAHLFTNPEPAHASVDPLNAAIEEGCRYVIERGAVGALVLPADLPLLAPQVIAEFLDEAGDAPIALASDRAGMGTNALLMRPPWVLTPAFGPGSFARHRALARERGLRVVSVRLPELAFDLDTPGDLAALGLASVAWREYVRG